MLRIFTCMSIAVLLLAASCKKGEPVEVKTFGFLELELVRLPGTPTLDIYVESTKMADSLQPGIIMGEATPFIISAEKSTRISFRKKGSDVVLLDTSITLSGGQKKRLRLALSEELGLKNFLKSNGNISPDSASFQLFNRLPVELQADSLQVNAILYKENLAAGQQIEVAVFENFIRTKLHPTSLTVPIKDNDTGEDLRYIVKFRNAKTGEFLLDSFGADNIVISFTPGKDHISSILGAELDFGDGLIFYLFNSETAVL